MVHIVLFGFAAAIYPQLLGVVLLILALPSARALLWICCTACVTSGVIVNLGIFAVFKSRGTIAGTSENGIRPGVYIMIGAIALLIASLIGTRAGRALVMRARTILPDRQTAGVSAVPPWRARLDSALSGGSLVIAAIVGALLAMPGPFDFLTCGQLARQHRGWVEAIAAISVFVALKFMLIEIPSVAYVIDAGGTAARVNRLSTWLQDNKLTATAVFVAIVGTLLIGRGVVGLI